MRKEYIEYKNDIPVNVNIVSIKNYPLTWHDSIRIFLVLEGNMTINIGNEYFKIEEKQIEIVNENEIYSIESQNRNLILVMDIDPNFFVKYNDQVENIYYYTNTLDDIDQLDSKYQKLRKYISILYYEILIKKEEYEEHIEKTLLMTMYHLLNNFHHLFYEEESLRDEDSLREDDVQFERFSRIITYIRENYNEKISLKEIAEREYLTSQYLSYKIKDTFGQSYNDFLNIIRVEESRKLLLGTDKSISKIAFESGFSHSRYYNKHFKNQFSCSPSEYRDKYKKTREEIEEEKDIIYHPIEIGLEYLESYLYDYDRYGDRKKIIKRHINLDKEVLGIDEKIKVIDLGDVSFLLEENYKNMLEETQKDMKFEYAIVNNLFSSDMHVYKENNVFINWSRVESILDLLFQLNLNPIINFTGVDKDIKEDFIENMDYLDMDKLMINADKLFNSEEYKLLEDVSGNKDKLEMNSLILDNHFFYDKKIIPKLFDEIKEENILDNDTFFNGSGLFTSNGLKKPIYYGYLFLSLIGEEYIHKEPGLIISISKRGFQILIYDSFYEFKDITSNKKISLNISNLKDEYILTKYELDKFNGSIYNSWKNLGSPTRLSKKHIDEFKRFINPKISYKKVKPCNIFNIVSDLEKDSVKLYLFKRL